MPNRTILTLLGAALAGALMTGCTSASQGQPQPQPTSTSATTATDTSASPPTSTANGGGQLPSDGAPKVKNPLDTSKYQQNPCQALAPAQLQELNLPTQGEQREQPLGLACDWTNKETRGNVAIGFADKNQRGLSGTYAARKAGEYVYFNELPEIEGFPAVSASTSDTRDLGHCPVIVGVTDQLIFLTFVQLSQANVGKKNPCEVAVQVAGMALRTMKAGG